MFLIKINGHFYRNLWHLIACLLGKQKPIKKEDMLPCMKGNRL